MNKRLDILERESDIRKWVEEKKPKSYICAELNCKPVTLNTYLDKLGIKYSGNSGMKGFSKINRSLPIEMFLTNKKYIQTDRLKKRLIKENYKDHKCERCGLTEWQGNPIPLELHHKDGNRFNNALDNIELLCPNCHALTDNYRGRGCKSHKENPNKGDKGGKKNKIRKMNYCVDCRRAISNTATRCKSCAKKLQKRKCERPSREVLKQLIRDTPFTKIGKTYGVSDKTIRNWCISYQLPHSSKEIKSYSDEDWLLI